MRRKPINHLVKNHSMLALINEGYEVYIKTDFIYKNCGLIFEDYNHFKSNTPFRNNYYIDICYDQVSGQFYRESTYNSKGEDKIFVDIPPEKLTCFVIKDRLYIG